MRVTAWALVMATPGTWKAWVDTTMTAAPNTAVKT